MMTQPGLADLEGREWLEPDGLGGFASGTASGIRTRRYHALLLAARTPPVERFVLVNGFEAWVETSGASFSLSSHRYAGGVIHPDGARRIKSFAADPWPPWRFLLEDGVELEQEIFVSKGAPLAAVSWRLLTPSPKTLLSVRPLMSGRDYHSLHHENPAFNFQPESADGALRWQPYPEAPHILSWINGQYLHQPDWHRNFLYEEERLRGLDCSEDLASPGIFQWDLSQGEAIWIVAAGGVPAKFAFPREPLAKHLEALRSLETHRRGRFPSKLHRAADAYLVRRKQGTTVIAGYPWFADWGRDTFIALRGLCLASRRPQEAREILLGWAGEVSEGMLPNRFPDDGGAPEFNSVDASLWYVVAVHDLLLDFEKDARTIAPEDRAALQGAVEAILDGYSRGTRFGIRADHDGLLASGEPGTQLTWMDARIGARPVTPRIGKPVEAQALWINALWIGSRFNAAWLGPMRHARESFQKRFWNEERRCLYDVVDAGHRAGAADPALRPNQIFAVGGLPVPILEGARARRVVDAVEESLLTPLGLRSLAPGEPGYRPRYEGAVRERADAYHQGTVWPWLLGPFAEAWVRVRGNTREARAQARKRFLEPFLSHLDEAGLGHISEIADGDAPHAPRGCPFQAWSLGEILRLDQEVLALRGLEPSHGEKPRRKTTAARAAAAGKENR